MSSTLKPSRFSTKRRNVSASVPATVAEVSAKPNRPPFPIALQRRAQETLRTHLRRSSIRLLTLAAADSFALLVARALFRAVRDQAVLGRSIADVLSTLTPPGTFAMPQTWLALLLALGLTGSYRAGDHRRS